MSEPSSARREDLMTQRYHKFIKINLKMEYPIECVQRIVGESINLEARINGFSEKEVIDHLISKTNQDRDTAASALIWPLATSWDNPEIFNKYVRYISAADYWHLILCNINMVLIEMWNFMHAECKEQIIRLLREAVRLNVKSIENVLMNAFRVLNGTGEWPTKIKCIFGLMSIIREHDAWFKTIKSGTALTNLIVMTVSHFIIDMPQPLTKDDTLKSQLTAFLAHVIRSRKIESAQLGRDFILIFTRIGKIPQLEEVWKEFIQKPTSFGVSSIEECLSRQNALGLHRISFELQRKIDHILTHANKNIMIYYDWMFRKHLRQMDSGSLRGEIVRYLCAMNLEKHPQMFDNRIHLLHLIISTAPQNSVDMQYLRNCLLLEWFACDDKVAQPQFANVEVALSLIRYSLSIQAPPPSTNSIIQANCCSPFANSLLENLCKGPDTFCALISDQIRKNLSFAMKLCRDRYVNILPQILEHYKIDRKISEQMRQLWPEYMRIRNLDNRNDKVPFKTRPYSNEDKKEAGTNKKSVARVPSTSDGRQHQQSQQPETSTSKKGENNGEILKALAVSPVIERRRLQREREEKEEQEYQSLLNGLKGEVKTRIEQLKSQWLEFSDEADKCEAVEGLLTMIIKNDDELEENQQEMAVKCLVSIIGPFVQEDKSLLPNSISEESLSEAFTHPIFAIFKMLCFPSQNDDSESEIMTNLMAAMREKDEHLTYVLLYFIKGTVSRTKDCIDFYREVARVSDKNVYEMLVQDLQLCALNDVRLFGYLVPFVFCQFEEEIMKSAEILEVVCLNLDSKQLRALISDIIREEIKIFRKDTFNNMVMSSTEWPTTAQWIFWHLVHADGVSMEWFLSILPKLESGKHEEAAANVLLMLKHMDREPWPGLIRAIFCRLPSKDDTFTTDALKVLIDDSDQCQKMAELVGALIKKTISNADIGGIGVKQNKKASGSQLIKVTLQQILEHLKIFSEACIQKKQRSTEGFFSKHYLQDAFAMIKSNDKCVVMLKKYSQLIGIVDIIAADLKEQSSRTLRGNRQGSGGSEKPNQNKRKAADDEDQNNKKRKATREIIQLEDSDSD